MSDTSLFLHALHDALAALDPAIVGHPALDGDSLSTLNNTLRLSVELRNDPGTHPDIAHAHVFVDLGIPGKADRLDCCIVGIHRERAKALVEAANVWTAAVAPPLFSLCHARPVLDASHFAGTEPWGVAGCHGFVGPLITRAFSEPRDLQRLQDAPLFDYASALAPPGLVHLAKVFLQAHGQQGWSRNLEIDGHAALHTDRLWTTGVDAPAAGFAIQFALFHLADQPAARAARQQVDDAIRDFVAAYARTRDTHAAGEQLVSRGLPAPLVHDLKFFVPMALTRVIFAPHGARFAPDFATVHPDGRIERDRHLMRDPIFARTTALAPSLFSSDLSQAAKEVSQTSADFHALNNALNAGSKLQDLICMPAIIPALGTADDTMQRAVPALLEEFRTRMTALHPRPRPHPYSSPAPAAKPTKPWWQFW